MCLTHQRIALPLGAGLVHVAIGGFHADDGSHTGDGTTGIHTSHPKTKGFHHSKDGLRIESQNIAVGTGDRLRAIKPLVMKFVSKFFSVHSQIFLFKLIIICNLFVA